MLCFDKRNLMLAVDNLHLVLCVCVCVCVCVRGCQFAHLLDIVVLVFCYLTFSFPALSFNLLIFGNEFCLS